MADRCAEISRVHGEPVGGTASRARRWLLVEQPGAWGRTAIHESDLPREVAERLAALKRDLPARVLLLRRPGSDAEPNRTSGPRQVFAGISRPGGGGWLERFDLPRIDDLLELDLTGLSTGTTVGGEPVEEPLYLVCTNGKHDACCAIFGLPTAQRLRGLLPDRTWECSHMGGDRFAGNLACLPEGILYGRLDDQSAIDAVTAHERGMLHLANCRGRSALSFPAQAAELAVRERHDLLELDAVRFRGETHEGNLHTVRFAVAGGGLDDEVEVRIRCHPAEEPRVMTCGTDPQAPPVHEVVSIEPVPVTTGR